MKFNKYYFRECLCEYLCNEIVSNIPSHLFRIFFYKKVAGIKVGKESSIAMHVKFRSPWKIIIEDNCAINQDCYLDGRGGLIIGKNVNISRGTSIHTATHNYNSKDFRYVEKGVVLEKDVWVASNCIILPGITLEKGSVVGAGSVVTKTVEKYTVVAGNPARERKKRNSKLNYKTNYFRLLS
ncbi:MAG: acyltransferase [Patescibacteria group bacterium]|jgi:maltose O-acetyltransferase